MVRRPLALKSDQRELEKLWGSYGADGLQGIGFCGLLAAQLSGAGPLGRSCLSQAGLNGQLRLCFVTFSAPGGGLEWLWVLYNEN